MPNRTADTSVASRQPEASALDVIALALSRRRLTFGLPLILAILVGAITLLWPRSYTASASFVPQAPSGGSLARFAGLAAQLGVAIPTQEAAQSPDFYSELIQSDAILRLVVDSPLVIARTGGSDTTLLRDLLGGRHSNPELNTEYAVERLRKRIDVSTTLKTGVVEVSCRTTDAGLSAAILSRVLSLVNAFNVDTRQSQAREQRKFLEARLTEARQELRVAEDAQESFLKRNREFRLSPELTFENNRLQRAVSLRQDLVTNLAQAYEQSRIDEVRDTPLITIIQAPVAPARPDRRLLVVKTLLAFLGGGLLAVLWVSWSATLSGSAWRGQADRDTVRQLVADVAIDLRSPWSFFRSGRSRDPASAEVHRT